MPLKFLLDTNIFAEALKTKPIASVLRHLQNNEGAIAMPSPVWHEMWFGCERLPKGSKRSRIETFLTDVVEPTVPILPYDRAAARWHADARAKLGRQGKSPPFVDGQIAAVSATTGLTLVSLNVKDFALFKGIKVTSWRR